MDDLEVIKKYIKHYKIRLQSQINYHTVYRKKVVSEIVTKKKMSKLILSSSMIRQSVKYIKTFKSYNDDIMSENDKIVNPKSFLLQFIPRARRIALYNAEIITKWEPEVLMPTKPLIIDYINLPYKEYGITDYGNYTLMSKVESCYCYKYNDDYFLIKRKIDIEFDFRKLYDCFRSLFDRIGLYISLTDFKELYKEQQINCEDLIREDVRKYNMESLDESFENMKRLDLLKWK